MVGKKGQLNLLLVLLLLLLELLMQLLVLLCHGCHLLLHLGDDGCHLVNGGILDGWVGVELGAAGCSAGRCIVCRAGAGARCEGCASGRRCCHCVMWVCTLVLTGILGLVCRVVLTVICGRHCAWF